MMSASSALMLALGALLVFGLAQPFVLKAACALTGVRSPRYPVALALVVGSLLACQVTGGLWSVSFGMLLGVMSAPLAVVSAVLVSLFTAGVVYSAGLRVALMKGVAVSAATHVLGFVCSGAVALAVRGAMMFVG